MAAGIVVRTVAPYLQGKDRDPAVVVVDEAGQFAVSLLSGHLGGANELARRVAGILGATLVITTATDASGLPALDVLAAQSGLAIENLPVLRQIHMALLEGRCVRLVDPQEHFAGVAANRADLFISAADLDAALARPGPSTVYIGCAERPFPAGWLILRPRNLVAGIGCHKDTPVGEIMDFLRETFRREGLSLLCLKALATIAARKNEAGLKEAARTLGVEFIWFTAEELGQIAVPNPSPHPARHLGVAGVAEAAALRAGAVELVVPKRKSANVTVAVARVA
jgi:cobalt-precorrin 5A hydrolase